MGQNKPSIKLQRIEQEDLANLAELFVRVFNHPPWNEDWSVEPVLARLTEIVNTPGFYGVTASILDADQRVGFVMGYAESWNHQKHFYIKEMCVETHLQGQGIGTMLMERLEKDLVQADISKLYLLTARDSSAESFYRKCGFYVSPKMIMMGKYLKA